MCALVCHRLRNILCFQLDATDPSLTDVKIGDFGLSKSGQTYYGGEEGLPAAWLSPEAFSKRTWSEKSDVWAFGVTLWELFSEGCVPFADTESDAAIGTAVVAGDRLGCPVHCPGDVYKVMQFCWQRRPEDRPTFRSLRILLRDAERDVAVQDALANDRSSRRKDSSASTTNSSGGDVSSRAEGGGNGGSDKMPPEDAQSRIEHVITRMSSSLSNARMQEEGARILANLAGTAIGRTHIAKSQGIEALIAAMRTHTTVSTTVWTCSCVQSLTHLCDFCFNCSGEACARVCCRRAVEPVGVACRKPIQDC
jgi:serine/threonine protein kinase